MSLAGTPVEGFLLEDASSFRRSAIHVECKVVCVFLKPAGLIGAHDEHLYPRLDFFQNQQSSLGWDAKNVPHSVVYFWGGCEPGWTLGAQDHSKFYVHEPSMIDTNHFCTVFLP